MGLGRAVCPGVFCPGAGAPRGGRDPRPLAANNEETPTVSVGEQESAPVPWDATHNASAPQNPPERPDLTSAPQRGPAP